MKTRLGLLLSASTLAGVLTLLIAGCNKPQELAGTPPPSAALGTAATKTVGDNVSDIDVTTKVKTALLGDEILKGFDIAVVTRNGDVRVNGIVDTQSQIDHADKLVRGIEGVHSIHDELSIKK
jgi:hyperosmotically inducible protein